MWVGWAGCEGVWGNSTTSRSKKAEFTLFPRVKKVPRALSRPANASLSPLAACPRPGMLARQKGDRTGSRASPGLWPHRASLSLLGFLHKMNSNVPLPQKNLKRGI